MTLGYTALSEIRQIPCACDFTYEVPKKVRLMETEGGFQVLGKWKQNIGVPWAQSLLLGR